MTKQEILDFNRKCATFLNIKEETNQLVAFDPEHSPLCSYANAAYSFDAFENEDNLNRSVWDYCNFHKDWNWIHVVIEKIESLNYGFDFHKTFDVKKYHVEIRKIDEDGGWSEDYIVNLYEDLDKKKLVVKAIDLFLTWYEKQK